MNTQRSKIKRGTASASRTPARQGPERPGATGREGRGWRATPSPGSMRRPTLRPAPPARRRSRREVRASSCSCSSPSTQAAQAAPDGAGRSRRFSGICESPRKLSIIWAMKTKRPSRTRAACPLLLRLELRSLTPHPGCPGNHLAAGRQVGDRQAACALDVSRSLHGRAVPVCFFCGRLRYVGAARRTWGCWKVGRQPEALQITEQRSRA